MGYLPPQKRKFVCLPGHRLPKASHLEMMDVWLPFETTDGHIKPWRSPMQLSTVGAWFLRITNLVDQRNVTKRHPIHVYHVLNSVWFIWFDINGSCSIAVSVKQGTNKHMLRKRLIHFGSFWLLCPNEPNSWHGQRPCPPATPSTQERNDGLGPQSRGHTLKPIAFIALETFTGRPTTAATSASRVQDLSQRFLGTSGGVHGKRALDVYKMSPVGTWICWSQTVTYNTVWYPQQRHPKYVKLHEQGAPL